MPFPLTSEEFQTVLDFIKQIYEQAGPQALPELEQVRRADVPSAALIRYFESPTFLTALVNSWEAHSREQRSEAEAAAIREARSLLALYPRLTDIDTVCSKVEAIRQHPSFTKGIVGCIFVLALLTTILAFFASKIYYNRTWSNPVYPSLNNCTDLLCNTTNQQMLDAYYQAQNATAAHNLEMQNIALEYTILGLLLATLALGCILVFFTLNLTDPTCWDGTSFALVSQWVACASMGFYDFGYIMLHGFELLLTSYWDGRVETLPTMQRRLLTHWVEPVGQIPADLPVSQVLAIAILTLIGQQDSTRCVESTAPTRELQQEVKNLLTQAFTALMLEEEQCLQQGTHGIITCSSREQELLPVTIPLLSSQGQIPRNQVAVVDMMSRIGYFKTVRYNAVDAHANHGNADNGSLIIESQSSDDDLVPYAAPSGS